MTADQLAIDLYGQPRYLLSTGTHHALDVLARAIQFGVIQTKTETATVTVPVDTIKSLHQVLSELLREVQ